MTAARIDIDTTSLRLPAAGMLVAGALLPLIGPTGASCPLRALTGVPCPLCGMTTSVSSSVHLELGDALAAAPAGVALAALAVVLVATGRPRRIEVPSWVLPLALGAMWVFQVFRFSML